MKSAKRILFLVPYPLHHAPSQRFRVESFLPILEKAGLKVSIHPFLSEATWNRLYRKGGFFLKAWGIASGFFKRWATVVFSVHRYDFVFVHREASPVGPPVFEWIIARLYRKKIIYDFDDAIWIPNTSSANYFVDWFKASWKVKYICRWSYKVVVGNDYLLNYAAQFSARVIRIPTCIDASRRPSANATRPDRLTIGWTGSHSTLKYLDELIPVIHELHKDVDFDFVVIADRDPALPVKNFQFVPWSEATEADDIARLDIGVMPLIADAWSEGKCGFKLIQYFAACVPAVATPVGVNKIIVEEGVNGFLCSSREQWKSRLRKLLTDESLRRTMGLAGRKKVEELYSIQSQAANFLQLFS